MRHSPETGSRSLVNTRKHSWTFSLTFYPSVSYSSDQMSCYFKILRLSASRFPASPILDRILQIGLINPGFQFSILAK
jgi:hypothetical protein